MSWLPTPGFLGAAYPWVVAVHVIFVIFLMASLLLMPRYFIYHQQCQPGSAEDAAWIERERRLRRILLNPALGLVWALGLALAFNIGAFSQGWFHVKLALVLILSGYHGWVVGYARKLANGERPMSDHRLRLLNEVPSLLAIAIVITVVVFGPRFGAG